MRRPVFVVLGEYMARPEKVAVVEEIREKLAASDAAVLAEYRGLKVGELAELRAALRPAGAEFKIFKNTLARRAAEESGLPDLVPMLLGPTAITFVNGDAVVAAKALRDFAKAHEALIVKGGLLGTATLNASELTALADVPPRDVLLAKLAGGFQAPLVKAAGLFQAFTRNFAYGVKALVDQRVAGGEALEVPAEPEPEAAEAPPAEAPAEAPEAETTEAPAAEATPAETPETEAVATETAPTEGD
jgi:large subunit ribosomal protein L10